MKFPLVFVCFAIVATVPVPTVAQTRAVRTSPRLEVSFGSGFLGASTVGEGDADLRARDDGTLSLFTTSSKFESSVPLEVRLGFPVTARTTFEIRAALSQPNLQTSIRDDFEGAPPLSVSERVDRYVVDGGVVFGVGKRQLRAATPFVAGGVGWVRQLHEGLTLTEDGVNVRGSGGVVIPMLERAEGAVRRVGVRAEAGVIVLSKGVSVGTGPTIHFTTLGSLYIAF